MPQVSGRITVIEFATAPRSASALRCSRSTRGPTSASLAEAKARAAAAARRRAAGEGREVSAEARVETAQSQHRRQAARRPPPSKATERGRQATASAAESDAARAGADLARFEGVGQSGGVSQQEIDRCPRGVREPPRRSSCREAARGGGRRRGRRGQAPPRRRRRPASSRRSRRSRRRRPRSRLAEADVLQAAAAVQTATLDVEYCSIARRSRAGGTPARPRARGRETRARCSRSCTLDPAYVEFTVTENDLLSVQHNMARPAPRRGAHPRGSRRAGTGVLTFLDNVIKEATGTVTPRDDPQPRRPFWPGRFVQGEARPRHDPRRGADPAAPR